MLRSVYLKNGDYVGLGLRIFKRWLCRLSNPLLLVCVIHLRKKVYDKWCYSIQLEQFKVGLDHGFVKPCLKAMLMPVFKEYLKVRTCFDSWPWNKLMVLLNPDLSVFKNFPKKEKLSYQVFGREVLDRTSAKEPSQVILQISCTSLFSGSWFE